MRSRREKSVLAHRSQVQLNKSSIVVVVMMACGLVSCDAVDAVTGQSLVKYKAVCANIIAENYANPPLEGNAFRYLDRTVSEDVPVKWGQDTSQDWCGNACADLVGRFGDTVYSYVSQAEFDKQAAYGKALKIGQSELYRGITGGGLYKFVPSTTPGCTTRSFYTIDDAIYPYSNCVQAKKVDAAEADEARSLPLVVVDNSPIWMKQPVRKPDPFAWSQLIRVFAKDGKVVFTAREAVMSPGLTSYANCGSDNRTAAEIGLLQAKIKQHE